ncbi:uncharacterized protein BDV14DRAFT_188870 [Aspergillus stella-maris]|uniref:uncharacterized protein n=1 Tax=Aspergillus stella-maris TaxID=1810926 RepID=UPI003CCD469A
MDSQVRRPYRSKRHPPCDRCRQKKLRCDPDGQIACRRCQASNTPCSFTRLHRSTSMPVALPYEPEPVLPAIQPSTTTATTTPTNVLSYPIADRSAPQQAIQTLDLLPGVSSQLMGTSGESDPFLLRHCKFDDYGLLHFHQVRFRNAGGVPLEEKIPVHYLVTDNALNDVAAGSTKSTRQIPTPRDELDSLIPMAHGQRLLALFLTYVYPSLPILSYFMASNDIQTIPVHLLAAIYASALPFVKFDEWLSIAYAYQPPPTAQLWCLALDLIMEELHAPHLSVLQAGILYLHKPLESSQQAAQADTAFLWSFVGTMVGLASSLGLQLECRPMGMPLWERRVRRRLWWAIYSEDKWRSLLMGRPPYIRKEEWDVSDLDESDFDTAPAERFMRVVKLARIADDVQSSLYSLRAAQQLSSNFPESLQTSRVLLRQLQEWLAQVTPALAQDGSSAGPRLCTCVHFAYLLLEVFIFRALLRPMVPSKPAPRLVDETEAIPFFPELTVDDYIAQIIDVENVVGEAIPAAPVEQGYGYGDKSIPIALSAAENCATSMLRVISGIEAREMGTFWYSWCRIGFATVSNFMLLLLVQSPSKEHALRAKKLLYAWQQALQSQSRGWDMMDLGLVRLNGPLGMGLGNAFYLPAHIQEGIESVTASGLRINQSRLWETIHETAKWGASHRWGERPYETGMARLTLTDDDAKVRRWFADEVKKLGCSLSVDQMGNMFARQKGRLGSSRPLIAMGSHLDTQPRGGRYDGILGVVGALEVLRTMDENNFQTNYDVGIINWTNEEGARFPKSMCSSGVWAGAIPIKAAWDLCDLHDNQVTLRSELERHGYLGDIPCSHESYPLAAHFELHIEQGPILQEAGRSIGVVTGAQGYRWLKFTVTGQDAHTGTTPLTARLEDECLESFKQISTADGKGVSLEWIVDTDSPAVKFHPDCISSIRTAALELAGENGWMDMTSGAGHDSVYASRHCPTAMIFVPCLDGVSHHPTEYCAADDCALGAQTLLESVVAYDRSLVKKAV